MFDAATEVETLDFSFRPHVDAAATVPEPSERAIVHYQRAYLAQLGLDVGADEEARKARVKELNEASEDAQVEHLAGLRTIVAEVCGGTPTADILNALPYRVLVAFAGWLYVQLTNPPKPTAAT